MRNKLTILVLEPTEFVHSTIERFYEGVFKSYGYECVFLFVKNAFAIIGNGKETLSIFKKNKIDLFICELSLFKREGDNDRAGLEVIKRVKTDFPNLFVICHSSHNLHFSAAQQFHPSFDLFTDKKKLPDLTYQQYISDFLKTKLPLPNAYDTSLFRKVFISYAREYFNYADDLYTFLKDHGFDPWLDKRKLLPGANWDNKIKRALKESDFIILLLSSVSVKKRGYIQREYKSALDYREQKLDDDIYIIPVLIDDCIVPDKLTAFQWIKYDEKNAFFNILNSLDEQRIIYLENQYH